MKIYKYLILIFSISQIIFLAHSFADSWINLSSENFNFIIHESYADQGQHIAEQSEKAYAQLIGVYKERPKYKILIVVDHRTNASNGSASSFPYPHIVIYPVLPTIYSSIGEYNEWVYELVLHELVHYLTFFPTHGVYKPVQWIFGNLFSPNFILLPSWFHEGLAVSLETHLTTGGRLRSENYKEMYKLLAIELKNGGENLSRINERYIPSYPYGQRPYFFGSLILNESTKSKRSKNVNDLIQDFSSALPPYNLYSSVKRNFGQSFRSVRKSLTDSPIKNISHKDFKFKGHSPQWLDQDRFLTINQSKDLFTQIIQNDLKTEKSKVLFQTLGSERVSLSYDKTLIVYDQMMGYQKLNTISDLYIYDLVNKNRRKLTFGAKLREASFSKDNSKLIAIQTDLANTKLVELEVLKPKLIKVIYAPEGMETRLSSPFYFEKDKIIFIEKVIGQKAKIKILNLQSNKIQTLDFSNTFEKIFWIESLNDKLLIHAKEFNKPRQHYILDQDFKAKQVTFDPIGTRSASIQDQQILVSRITPEDYKTAAFKNYNLLNTGEPIQDFDIQLSKGLLFDTKNSKKVDLKTTRYSAFDYMIPKYWYPFITPNYGGFAGQSSISISTGSTDPLGLNSYAISLRRDTISERLSGGINYFRADETLVWGFFANQFESPLTEDISRTFQTLALSSRYDFGNQRYFGHAVTFGLSHTDANLEDLQQIKSMGPQVSYEYNSLRQQPSRIAASHGIFSSINASHFIKQQDYFSYNSVDAYFETYFSNFILPPTTSLKVFSKVIASDESLPTVFTPVNLSGYFTTSRQQNSFVIRGYPSGIFQARKAAYTLGVEYYFPILNIFNGPESLPLFFRRIYGSLVADAGSFNGRIFDGVNAFVDHEFDDVYSGAGVELHMDLTVGHYVPIKISLGFYNPIKKLNGIEDGQVFLNVTTPALP